jgi:hypothetical protein
MHAPITPHFPSGSSREIYGDYSSKLDVELPLFTLLQREMHMDGTKSG